MVLLVVVEPERLEIMAVPLVTVEVVAMEQLTIFREVQFITEVVVAALVMYIMVLHPEVLEVVELAAIETLPQEMELLIQGEEGEAARGLAAPETADLVS
jgi:hypothetical protein